MPWPRQESHAGYLGWRGADQASDEEKAMFKRGAGQDEVWEGLVTDKKRSSPDGQNMFHRVMVPISDGRVGGRAPRSPTVDLQSCGNVGGR